MIRYINQFSGLKDTDIDSNIFMIHVTVNGADFIKYGPHTTHYPRQDYEFFITKYSKKFKLELIYD